MKVLFISTLGGSNWGGSEELWLKTAKELLAQNHQVAAFYFDWFPEPEKIKNLRTTGALVFKHFRKPTIFFERAFNKLIRDKKVDVKIFSVLFEFNPDIIIISQGASFDLIYDKQLMKFIEEINKPYFLISQFNYENGGAFSREMKELSARYIQRAAVFYFVSKRNYEVAKRQAAAEFANKKIIDNPINIDKPQILPWPETKKIKMACVARLECTYKGQDILMEALADFIDVDFELNLFGSGADEHHLRDLIKFYGLSEKVFIKGHVNNIARVWADHHLLVLPSIAEGTPLALQECMLCARTALVTDVGGCNQLIIDNQTGFLAAVANKKNLSLNLKKVFDTSREDLRILGINAYKRATEVINLNSELIIINDMKQTLGNY